jgi:hypothetical protein
MRTPGIAVITVLVAGSAIIGLAGAEIAESVQKPQTPVHSTYWAQGYDYGNSPQAGASYAAVDNGTNSDRIPDICTYSAAGHPNFTDNQGNQYIAGCIAGLTANTDK